IIKNWQGVPNTNEEYRKKINETLSFSYPFQEVADHRAKQSVTEIKRRHEEIDAYSDKQFITRFRAPLATRPRFMQKEKILTAAEIGTAMHAVMQHIPFTKLLQEAEISQFISQLVIDEKLTEMEANEIDVQAIEQFFLTDIYQMIMDSEKVEREVPFTYMLDADEVYPNWQSNTQEKVLIQGVVDCIIHTTDGVVILDYKTDSIKEDQVTEDLIETLKQRYATQVNLYKRALEGILQESVQGTYLYFFAKNLTIIM